MPDKDQIMSAIRKGLDSLDISASDPGWTKAVLTKLCTIGRGFGFQVGAKKDLVDEAHRDRGEWLYDTIWLDGCDSDDDLLAGVPLVVECEWANDKWEVYWKKIIYDFNKLLLARAQVRLMIFDGSGRNDNPGSEEIAKLLAARIRKFYGPSVEKGWLLAGWEPCAPVAGERGEKDWRFRYYTVGANAILREFKCVE